MSNGICSTMTSEMTRDIVAGHGGFAEGILSAVEQIAGLSHRFVSLSNAGLEPGAIERLLRDTIAAHGTKVIFTDLPAGSCTQAARRVQRDLPELVLVTGAALPTILAYACGSDIGTAAEKGRAAQIVVEGTRDA